MNYVIRMKIGTSIRLRSAETKEAAVEHIRTAYAEAIARGQRVVFATRADCKTPDKYEVVITIHDDKDQIILPQMAGGTFVEVDEAINKYNHDRV